MKSALFLHLKNAIVSKYFFICQELEGVGDIYLNSFLSNTSKLLSPFIFIPDEKGLKFDSL